MMKTTINYLLLGAIAIIALSCTKENIYVEDDRLSTSITLSGIAEQQTESENTKTAIGEGNTIVWSTGDKLSVLSYTSGANNDEFTLTSGAGATSGRFNGNLTEGASKYYAFYPYSADTSFDGTNITFTLPQNQTYAAGSFANGANPSIAMFTDPHENLTFKNICGVLKLSLTGSVTVTKIALSDNAGETIWGNVSLTADENLGTDSQTFKMTYDKGNNTIYLTDINETLTEGTAKDFYFVVPKGAFASGFTAYFYTSEGIYTYLTSDKPHSIVRSKIKPMKEAAITIPTARHLGDNSNCFIVPCAGTYSFTANKGKGGDAVTPESVEVLWETKNTTVAPEEGEIINTVSSSGSTISFKATGAAGNAVVAAKVGGEIVWSWHIWSTAAPVEERKFDTPDYGRGTYVWQDRYLGAVSKTPGELCSGLQYLWGRKDPFYGSASLTENNVPMATSKAFNVVAKSDENSTIEALIKHPMDFILTSNGTSYSWKNDDDLTGLWSQTQKTQYDPCPRGYRIPSRGEIFQIASNFNSDVHGMTVKGDFFCVNGYLPGTSSYNAQISFVSEVRMCYWTATLYDKMHPFYFYVDSEIFNNQGHDISNGGRNVRCVKE